MRRQASLDSITRDIDNWTWRTADLLPSVCLQKDILIRCLSAYNTSVLFFRYIKKDCEYYWVGDHLNALFMKFGRMHAQCLSSKYKWEMWSDPHHSSLECACDGAGAVKHSTRVQVVWKVMLFFFIVGLTSWDWPYLILTTLETK